MRLRLLGTAAAAAVVALGLSGATTPGARAQTGCQFTDAMVDMVFADNVPRFSQSDLNSLCAFHQWSWATFLWLVQPSGDNGELRFETMYTAGDVIDGGRTSGNDALAPRFAKSDQPHVVGPTRLDEVYGHAPFDEVAQAGSSSVLIDQNGRAVYYGEYVNEVFYDFAVKDHALQVPANLRAFDATTDFPVDTLELKVAWKIVDASENPEAKGWFTREAEVRKLKNVQGGSGITLADETERVTVALVGFHVVGVQPGHPEMIWATFEHNENVPNFQQNQAPNDPVSSQDFTFYKAGTPAQACNQYNATTLRVDYDTQVVAPITNACNQFPFGNDPNDPKADANSQAIRSLNQSSWDVIERQSPRIDPIWRNYREVGAVWFKKADDLEPNDPLRTDAKLIGSLRLNNAVIETFTQQDASQNNCFKCHNTQTEFFPGVSEPLPGKNVGISHILLNAYQTRGQSDQQ